MSIYQISKFLKGRGHDAVLIAFDSLFSTLEERDIGRVHRYPGLVDTPVGLRPRKSGKLSSTVS